jgi:hypothetical protein
MGRLFSSSSSTWAANTGSWDEELIKDIFWEEDSDIILSLPILQGNENRLIWHFDKRGQFSVRSAYKVSRDAIVRDDSRNGGQGGSAMTDHLIWEKLWKLHCPNKIKHFLWSFTHNSHPLRRNLARRGLKIDAVCPVCGRRRRWGSPFFQM